MAVLNFSIVFTYNYIILYYIITLKLPFRNSTIYKISLVLTTETKFPYNFSREWKFLARKYKHLLRLKFRVKSRQYLSHTRAIFIGVKSNRTDRPLFEQTLQRFVRNTEVRIVRMTQRQTNLRGDYGFANDRNKRKRVGGWGGELAISWIPSTEV